MKKRIFSLFLIMCMLSAVFAGCTGKTIDKDFLFPIDGNVRTLDPQSAQTADELLIVENTMEGLVRKSADGTIGNGIAQSWEISSDKLVYTFNLRDNCKWDLNANIAKMMGDDFDPPITAHDFVFAFQRACNPNTKAPYFNTIASIKNAVAVHSAQLNSDSLGVVALNDFTLQITLENADEQFLQTLTTPIAMPCNQTFFEATKGRYGLEKDYTLFNGPFYLSKWLETSFILRRSEVYDKNGGYSHAIPLKVTLNVPADRNTVMPKLLDGTYDVAIITGQESTQMTDKDKINLTPYENTVWSYIFNCKDTSFENKNIRLAFCHAFQTPVVPEGSYLSLPQGIAPKASNINNKSLRDYVGTSQMLENNQSKAEDYWSKGLRELSPTEMSVTILCTKEMEEYAKQSVQGLQQSIARRLTYQRSSGVSSSVELSIKIKVMTEEEMNKEISMDTFQIALYPIRATDDNAVKFFSQFSDFDNMANLADPQGASLMNAVEDMRSGDEIASALAQYENSLLEGGAIFPVLSESGYFATTKSVTGIQFTTHTGRVNFVFGERKD